MGDLDGRLRVQRGHVQQLLDRAGRRSHRAGGHLPAGLPAPPGDAAGLDPQAARQDPEHEARAEPGQGDHRAGAGPAAPAAAGAQPAGLGTGKRGGGHRGSAGKRRNRPVTETSQPQQPAQASQPGQVSQADDPAAPDAAEIAGRERLSEQVVRTGMFGVQGTPDTSGYGGLQVRQPPTVFSPRPYGSYFDDVADALGSSLEQSGLSFG